MTTGSPPAAARGAFLFSVDVEDVRLTVPDGLRYRARVPELTARYAEWLAARGAHATFFVVGDVARAHPDLVRTLVRAGHEVACHSDHHVPLDRLGPDAFTRDTAAALDALAAAGADGVRGYRAPTCSLTPATAWAHDRLAALGFTYSSSVLPARNPLYGWPGFGGAARRMPSGVVEVPVTVGSVGPIRVPVAAGVYFRTLPFALVRGAFRRAAAAGAVVGYFHPYDIDTAQERFMHPGLGGSRVYNWLMYRNRGDVFRRLDRLADGGTAITTYARHVERLAANGL